MCLCRTQATRAMASTVAISECAPSTTADVIRWPSVARDGVRITTEKITSRKNHPVGEKKSPRKKVTAEKMSSFPEQSMFLRLDRFFWRAVRSCDWASWVLRHFGSPSFRSFLEDRKDRGPRWPRTEVTLPHSRDCDVVWLSWLSAVRFAIILCFSVIHYAMYTQCAMYAMCIVQCIKCLINTRMFLSFCSYIPWVFFSAHWVIFLRGDFFRGDFFRLRGGDFFPRGNFFRVDCFLNSCLETPGTAVDNHAFIGLSTRRQNSSEKYSIIQSIFL